MNWYVTAQSQQRDANEQWMEYNVAKFIEGKFMGAYQLLLNDLKAGRKKRILEYLKQVWPGGSLVDFFLPKDKFPEAIAKHPIQMKSGDNETYMINGQYAGMKLNPFALDQAKNETEAKTALDALFMGIAHETQHIFAAGSDYEVEDEDTKEQRIAKSIAYLSNAGEMQTHAREMAYHYIQSFPNDTSIDPQKLNSLLPNMKPNFNAYINSFADPDKQERYRSLGDVQKVHDTFMNLLGQFFSRYKTVQPQQAQTQAA